MSNLLPSSQASDIISYVRSRCRLGSAPPNAVFGAEQMLIALNDINEWFTYWPIDNGGVAPWKFTLKHKLYAPVAPTSLAVQAAAGASTLTLADGSGLDSPVSDAAAGYIKHSDWAFQFFTYEGRAGAGLSGVSTIDITAASGSEVRKLYTLPSDFGRTKALLVNGRELKRSDSEAQQIPPYGLYFLKYLVSSSGYDNYYIVLPEGIGSGTTMVLDYVKRPTKISLQTSKVDAPDGEARWGLIKKFESFCWFHQGELDMANACALEADEHLKAFSAAQSGDDASADQGPSFDLDC